MPTKNICDNDWQSGTTMNGDWNNLPHHKWSTQKIKDLTAFPQKLIIEYVRLIFIIF